MTTMTVGKQSSVRRKSRAVIRTIEPGTTAECTYCGERVKFQARSREQQVICNVYVKGRWDRVEHYHAHCYEAAKRPYGTEAA